MSSPLLGGSLDPSSAPNVHDQSPVPEAVLESKQITKIEEGSGSDSGNDVRSPSSHHDTGLNNSANNTTLPSTGQSSSASPSNQSAGSSGFGEVTTPPAIPFFAPYSANTNPSSNPSSGTNGTTTTPVTSSSAGHFYPNQYYPAIDMYQQYTQNIYANQGDF